LKIIFFLVLLLAQWECLFVPCMKYYSLEFWILVTFYYSFSLIYCIKVIMNKHFSPNFLFFSYHHSTPLCLFSCVLPSLNNPYLFSCVLLDYHTFPVTSCFSHTITPHPFAYLVVFYHHLITLVYLVVFYWTTFWLVSDSHVQGSSCISLV